MSKPIYDECDAWATYSLGKPDVVLRTPMRKRKPDFIAMVKRAQLKGLDITGMSITKDGAEAW